MSAILEKDAQIATLKARVVALEEALQTIAIQDLDENGDPDTLERLSNYIDVADLVAGLIHCAATARAALAAKNRLEK